MRGLKVFHVSHVSKVADDTIGLLKWYGANGTAWCEAYRDEKAEKGKAFHHILETTLKGENIDLGEHEGPVGACLTFLQEQGLQYINSEVHGENKKLDLEGTYDCLVSEDKCSSEGVWHGIRKLLDWKLTSGLRMSNYVQGGGYSLLHPDVFDEYMVVRPYLLKVEPKHTNKILSGSGSTRYKWKGKVWALEVRHFNKEQLNGLVKIFKKCLDIVKFREETK